MPTISENQLAVWTKPAFGNEEEKAENTESLIFDAIRAHDFLATLPITVFAKGSYKNNTNVRRDSDVDVAVHYTGIVFFDYQGGVSEDQAWRQRGIEPYAGSLRDSGGSFDIDGFKDSIGEALAGAFGKNAVERSNKVFTVREGSRSLAADVVPCVTHDQHFSPSGYHRGIQLLADRKPRLSVVNYPEQHYKRSVEKNKATSLRFKSVGRILKNLENQMVANRDTPELASYLIECLAFNCPASCFAATSWAERVRKVLAHVWEDTEIAGWETRWVEVNNIKYLFHETQRWTLEQAREFVYDAWQYVEKS